MKFTIETGALKEGLATVSVGIEERLILPILGSVKIETGEGEIILSTTNLDIYVIQKIPAKVSSAGAMTVAFDLFSKLVARITSSQISITQEGNSINFKGGEVVAEIETLPADEFPPLLEQKGTAKQCESGEILKPFSMLRHAICDNPNRYALHGISLETTADGGDFVASTGYLIAVYHGQRLSEENVIVPESFVRAVLKIQPAGTISVTISNGSIKLEAATTTLQGKLVEATFPGWKQVVPDRSDKALSCGRQDLMDALRICSLFTDRQISGLYIEGKGKEIEVSFPGKCSAKILGTELSGQPEISLRINARFLRFLLETLGVLEGENVRIQMKNEDSPIRIEEGPFMAILNRLQPV